MNNKTLYTTLSICAILAFASALLIGVALGYALLVTISPALCALFVVKLTSAIGSWRGVVLIYVALLIPAVMVQGMARVI